VQSGVETALKQLRDIQKVIPPKPLNAYIVSYDLKFAPNQYVRLVAELQSSPVWSLVEEVRTRWPAHDQELIGTMAALRRLKELVEPSERARAA
jgi:hypothetical protein